MAERRPEQFGCEVRLNDSRDADVNTSRSRPHTCGGHGQCPPLASATDSVSHHVIRLILFLRPLCLKANVHLPCVTLRSFPPTPTPKEV